MHNTLCEILYMLCLLRSLCAISLTLYKVKVLLGYTYPTIVRFFFKLALGGGASDMSRDTHCATCRELVFIKLYLYFLSNTTCFYYNLKIILNKFGNIMGTPQVPIKKKSDYSNAKSLACETANEHALICTRETCNCSLDSSPMEPMTLIYTCI